MVECTKRRSPSKVRVLHSIPGVFSLVRRHVSIRGPLGQQETCGSKAKGKEARTQRPGIETQCGAPKVCINQRRDFRARRRTLSHSRTSNVAPICTVGAGLVRPAVPACVNEEAWAWQERAHRRMAHACREELHIVVLVVGRVVTAQQLARVAAACGGRLERAVLGP